MTSSRGTPSGRARAGRKTPAAAPGPRAAGQPPATRRGDLVVIHLRTRDWSGATPRDRDEYHAGQVTSVTRDGLPRLYRPAGTLPGESGAWGRPDPGQAVRGAAGFQQFYTLSADAVDVDGALATAACNTWPSHETTICAYPTLDEVRAAIRPHRKDRPGWERLHDAALAWQRQRAEARSLLGAAGFGAYEEAVAAANGAYRQALAGRPAPGQPRASDARPRLAPRHLSAAGEAGWRSWYSIHGSPELERFREDAARHGTALSEGLPPGLDGAPAALRALHGHALAHGWDALVAFRPSPSGSGTWRLSAVNPAVHGAVITATWDDGKRASRDSAAHGSIRHLHDAVSAAPRVQAEPAPGTGGGTEPEP